MASSTATFISDLVVARSDQPIQGISARRLLGHYATSLERLLRLPRYCSIYRRGGRLLEGRGFELSRNQARPLLKLPIEKEETRTPDSGGRERLLQAMKKRWAAGSRLEPRDPFNPRFPFSQ